MTHEFLPIDPWLPRIVAHLKDWQALVVSAPPGAGKTTRVPRALYDAGFARDGDILVLEPRRLAARLAADRVADELGEKLGETVGYSIRFETVAGPKTHIRFLTEGVLSRRIVQDPDLSDVAVVVLDEFHERHMVTDLALAFLRRLLELRQSLRLVVMSATLDAGPIASYLGAPIVQGEGRRFEVRIEHEEKRDDRPLHEKVASSVARLWCSGIDGHILVFLPGSYEIRRAGEALQTLAAQSGLLILPLHGDLSSDEQARAVRESTEFKVILTTNVAETSVTIPGVAAVVDSGLARMARHSAWSGLPTLTIEKISKASAEQRAGRAGRTRSGRVLRLYSERDYDSRPERTVPEVMRSDLAETLLVLHGAGIRKPDELPWFEPPPTQAVHAAEELLFRLGALDANARLTAEGRRMLRFPVHPRLARLIVEGERLGIAEDCCAVAALMTERDIRLDTRSRLGAAGSRRTGRAAGLSDVSELLNLFREAEQGGFDGSNLRRLGLDPRSVQSAARAQKQLRRLQHSSEEKPIPKTREEESLRLAILVAFPDRVARRRATGSGDLLLSAGGSAVLSDTSVVHSASLMVAVDAEERRGQKGSSESRGVLVRLASAIEPEWLAAVFPDSLEQSVELVWNEQAGRVDELRRTRYCQLVLEEAARAAPHSDAVSRLLADEVLERGLNVFNDSESLAYLRARLELLAKCFPELRFPVISDDEVRRVVEELCAGCRSLAEVSHRSLADSLAGRLTGKQRSLLSRETPERVNLVRRRNVRVHYETGQMPWIESRLQDFLGMTSVPSICGGQVRLTVHLLAPNGRAVQVTQDLAGFWKRHYPAVRRELQRRYPRHAWPDPAEVA